MKENSPLISSENDINIATQPIVESSQNQISIYLPPECIVDEFQLRMTKEIVSLQLLPIKHEKNLLTYDINAHLTSLNASMHKSLITIPVVIEIFEQLEKLVSNLGRYLLYEAHVQLSPAYIFLDARTDTWYFAYLPLMTLPYAVQKNDLSGRRQLLNWLFCHENSPFDKNHITWFSNYLENKSLSPLMALMNFKHQVGQTVTEPRQKPMRKKDNSKIDKAPGKTSHKVKASPKKLSPKRLFSFQSAIKHKSINSSNKDEPLNQISKQAHETMVLNQNPYLINMETHERITLYYEYSQVGRSKQSHIHIPHETVSTVHASIKLKDQKYYLNDEGSKNGTYLNHNRINKNDLLSNGDEIAFGDKRFIFINS